MEPCFQSRIFLQNMTLPPSPPLYLQCMQWRGFSDVPHTQNPKFPRQTSPPTLHQGIGHNAAAARKRSHWPRQDITNAHASKLFLQECPNFPRGALLCYWTAYSRPVSSSRCEKCTRDPHTLWSPHPVSAISGSYRTHTATDRETLWVFDSLRLAFCDVAVAERAVHPKGIVGNDSQ